MEISSQQSWLSIELTGHIDQQFNFRHESHLVKNFLESDKNIILNLEAVTYIDSQGLSLLVNLNRNLLSKHRQLALCNIPAHAQLLFEITRIEHVIHCFNTYRDACESLS